MVGDRTRVAWVWNGEALDRNAAELKITPNHVFEIREPSDGRRVIEYQRTAHDPRTVLSYQIQATWFGVGRRFIQRVERELNFLRDPFPLKMYQLDLPRLDADTPDLDAAEEMVPANFPVVGSCASWFASKRGVSSDAGEGPFLYVNDTLQTSGFTWDYEEGKVTFTAARSSADAVRVFYVWKPKLAVTAFDPNPWPRAHYDWKFSPTLTLEQL